MPSERSYLPVYVKAEKAFQQETESKENEIFNKTPSSSPTRLSEPTSSPSISGENSQALSSSPRTPSWRHTILSPVTAFHVLRQSKEELSLLAPTAPSSSANTEGFNLPLLGQVKWEELKKAGKEWIKDPKNLALCLWGLAVGISGALLFLVMVGLLDKQLPSRSERDAWFEVNNQILNALFTMMCLYLHPQRCLHLVMLLRWRPKDISKLRQVYCKNGTYKPHEWMHMLVVVVLLHINCFAQYALCSLNWGFKWAQRPPVGVGLCLAIGAPAAAGIYSILSPLGKNFYTDEENGHKLKLGRTSSLRIGRAPRFSTWKGCNRAFSEASSMPSFSEWHSAGAFDFATEASSPGPFQTYFPGPFSFPYEASMSPTGREGGQIRVVSELGSRSPMHAPAIQTLQERGTNNNF